MTIHNRLYIMALTFALTVVSTVPGSAQAADPKAALTFASSMDVSALIAKAKATRKPDQATVALPIVRVPPYTISLEYRMPDLGAPAAVHPNTVEIFFVVEGTGTAVTGGKLKDESRMNENNLLGKSIEGGTARRISKGDILMVPVNTPHQFMPSGGALVVMSLHVPRGGN